MPMLASQWLTLAALFAIAAAVALATAAANLPPLEIS